MELYLLALRILFPEILAITFIIYISIVVWRFLAKKYINQRWWRFVNIMFSALALMIILCFTLLGRECSEAHRFILYAHSEPWDLIPELYRNLFLFYPLGLFLPYAISKNLKTERNLVYYLIPLALSLSIEIWQYAFGTGVAQVTDVIMNTLGASIGVKQQSVRDRNGQKDG